MKEGCALCVSCGREPRKKESNIGKKIQHEKSGLEEILEKKIELLSKELEEEEDHVKQQEILKSINSMLEILEKMKEKQ